MVGSGTLFVEPVIASTSAVSPFPLPTIPVSTIQGYPIDIVHADPWTLVREGLALLFNAMPGVRVVAQVDTSQAALAEMERCLPHLALLDLELSDIAASEVLRRVREKKLRTKCAILATNKERKIVLEALRYGASATL